MRKLVVGNFITLDGVMEAPGPADSSLPELRGWSMPYMNDEIGMSIMAQIQANDGMLIGRKTYDTFASFWPNIPDSDPFGALMNGKQKYVVSTTLKSADWKNSTLINGNVIDEIRKLKAQPGGNLGITGSGDLIRSLMQHDLIDQFDLLVCPVVLGQGKHLFGEADAMKCFKLVSAIPYNTGAVMLSYELDRKA
jgi:dihydrofolate reductase